MIHVSPCGWYCFAVEGNGGWDVQDTKEKTVLIPDTRDFTIELLSARKEYQTSAEEISQFHEEYLKEESIVPTKTVFSENPFNTKFYVTRGYDPNNQQRIICHAFWNNYCVFIQCHGKEASLADRDVQAFYDILNSLQPLVTS